MALRLVRNGTANISPTIGSLWLAPLSWLGPWGEAVLPSGFSLTVAPLRWTLGNPEVAGEGIR
jgi:hypothetical protein